MGIVPDAASSLMLRRFRSWPDWRCVAVERVTAAPCLAPARWQQRPVDGAETSWTFCDRHRPPGATAIPADAPFTVTRIRLEVAVTGAPGAPQASVDEGVRRLVYALEDVGGLVTHLAVRGRKASRAAVDDSLGRLQLAGHPEPVAARPRRIEPPGGRGTRPAWRRWRTG